MPFCGRGSRAARSGERHQVAWGEELGLVIRTWNAVLIAFAVSLVAGGDATGEAADGGPGKVVDKPGRPTRQVRCLSAEELERWSRPLDEIRIDTRPSGELRPVDCSQGLFVPAGRKPDDSQYSPRWPVREIVWLPSEFSYQPLYFDDTPLERYGQTASPVLQPFLSGLQFFGTLPVLPYKIGVNRVCDRVYSLGYYRPGSPTPAVRQRLPLELDASLLEAGAWLGLIFAVP